MKLVKPSFEILEQDTVGLMQHIERCARTCYKSEDKITKESAPKFVDMLIKRGHTAMVEHGTVYLKVNNAMGCPHHITQKYEINKYSNVVTHEDRNDLSNRGIPFTTYNVTTNYRVLLQNGWLDDLQYQCEPTEYHEKRVTVKFICDRGVSHEFVRHRVFSFAQESTRYCNYSKDKFGMECTFIIPSWLDISEDSIIYDIVDGSPVFNGDTSVNNIIFLRSLANAESDYFTLLDDGWIAQQARAVLPNSLKTELVMTGTIEQWEGFFKLRCTNDAHPQARELAIPLHEEFIKRGWSKNKY